MAEKRTEKAAAKKAPAKRAPARAKRATARSKPKKGTPTHEEVATRAYFIALESDTSDPLHDWLRAEDELTGR